jgi:hypothetical protein
VTGRVTAQGVTGPGSLKRYRFNINDSIQPEHWQPEYTTDLLDLLHVLGRLIALEPAQADLLNRICASPLRGADELRDARAFTDVQEKPGPVKDKSKSKT